MCFLFMKSLLHSRERRSRLPFLISSPFPTLKRRSTRVSGKPALLQTRKIAAWGLRASLGLWLLSWNPEEELGCQASEVGCALPLEAALFTHLQPLELYVWPEFLCSLPCRPCMLTNHCSSVLPTLYDLASVFSGLRIGFWFIESRFTTISASPFCFAVSNYSLLFFIPVLLVVILFESLCQCVLGFAGFSLYTESMLP